WNWTERWRRLGLGSDSVERWPDHRHAVQPRQLGERGRRHWPGSAASPEEFFHRTRRLENNQQPSGLCGVGKSVRHASWTKDGIAGSEVVSRVADLHVELPLGDAKPFVLCVMN